MSSFYNLDFEKQFISGVIKKPEILAETPFICESDFSNTNRSVFSAIKAILAEGKILDKFLLIEKLKLANIKIGGEIDASLYIEALDLIPINETSAIQIAKEIKNLTVARELNETARQIQNKIQELKGENAIKLVNEVTAIFNKKINILDNNEENQPKDIFSGTESYIEGLGNSDESIDGLEAPFPIYKELFGDFTKNSLTTIVSRAKSGKSTFLMNVAIECALSDPNAMFLILDTELEIERIQRRAVSAFSGINEYYLRSNLWRKNPEMTKKVRDTWRVLKPLFGRIHHIFVAGKPIEEIISIIKRWHYKNIAFKNKKCMIIYDYIKLGSGDIKGLGVLKDYQLVGHKVDLLKQTATELQCPIISSAQSTRANETRDNTKKVALLDGSVTGLSDSINTLSSSVLLWQRLTLDQISEFPNGATHFLMGIYTRDLGPNAGFDSWVKYENSSGKITYSDNFIFYKSDKFKISEIEDLKRFAARRAIKDIKTDCDNQDTNKLLD